MLSGLNSNLKFANNSLVAATCDGEDKATYIKKESIVILKGGSNKLAASACNEKDYN